MGVKLYPHNETAYHKAVQMLNERGRAAVIHPTGTGKSIIGFKLCEDNPGCIICWLSPSEYIWKTQLDNLEKTDREHVLQNVEFYTYAKLSNMSKTDMSKIKPSYIILDEFHRCGAEMWGTGVERLLSCYPDVPMLGLSATAVRYLDNCRDMADELFDGNVASEITLGEAIVRGILNPPRYIMSIYNTDILAKYEKRIRCLSYKEQQSKAQKYLEALRRTLNMADGLDTIFEKYMTDCRGKYIVFCASYEAMQDAIDKASDWFGKIDSNPHIYSVYSEDKLAAISFTSFKEDSDSGHLRLLYCIDALNEGIHVDDVDGVILLRPTVSPIVYKQQIGRTLSASKSKTPVIFDVVNNIENLYSIDAIREEMDVAVNYIKFGDGGGETVNESFEIISEVRNCLELFDMLEGVLTSTWDTMYMEAKQHYKKYGDLIVEQRYITETGYPLGRWLATQRTNRRKGDPALSKERIEKLDAIGMDWKYASERSFERGYEHAKAYYIENGNLDVPTAYDTADGFHLGSWCRMVRDRYQAGRLEEGYIEILESIGMKWESVYSRKWNTFLECARGYYIENGNLNVPADYMCFENGENLHLDKDIHSKAVKNSGVGKKPVSTDGHRIYKLGIWISTQRDSYAKGRLSQEQICALEEIGMTWNRQQSKWDKGYEAACQYISEHGDINSVPAGYKYDDLKLANWIRAQRSAYNNGKLSKERIEKLESIGFIWNPQEALWENGYLHAAEYVRRHGNIDVPPHYVCEDGYKLKNWLVNQGTRYKNGRMTDIQKYRLEELGVEFERRSDVKSDKIA